MVTSVAFKNCGPFTRCFTKYDGTTRDDAEDLDLIIPMYNLIKYSSIFFWHNRQFMVLSKDEATNLDADIAKNDDLKSFEYKTKLLENTFVDGKNSILKNARITVPLNLISSFW